MLFRPWETNGQERGLSGEKGSGDSPRLLSSRGRMGGRQTIGGRMASRDEMAEAALALDGVQSILKMGMTGDEEITPDLCALMRAGVLSAIRVVDPDIEG